MFRALGDRQGLAAGLPQTAVPVVYEALTMVPNATLPTTLRVSVYGRVNATSFFQRDLLVIPPRMRSTPSMAATSSGSDTA